MGGRWRRWWCSFVSGHPVLGGTPCSGGGSARRSGLGAVFFPPVAFLRRPILAWQVFSEASNCRSQLKDPEGTAVARSVANILLGKKKILKWMREHGIYGLGLCFITISAVLGIFFSSFSSSPPSIIPSPSILLFFPSNRRSC